MMLKINAQMSAALAGEASRAMRPSRCGDGNADQETWMRPGRSLNVLGQDSEGADVGDYYLRGAEAEYYPNS